MEYFVIPQMEKIVQHVFIIGSKGIPGRYGGYESFVDHLTGYQQNNEKLKYHIACKANGSGSFKELDKNSSDRDSQIQIISGNEYIYHNARCFRVHVPQIGPAQAIYYDIKALCICCDYIKKYHIPYPIVYILACRIGPFVSHFQKKIHKLGGKLYVNPDGHEWLRGKWSRPIKAYWKLSEKLMVEHADLLICDSRNIEKYIQSAYSRFCPRTVYISYGADVLPSVLQDDDRLFAQWLESNQLDPGKYYLIVGRFVPENNFEIMIREFMNSSTEKKLAVITTADKAFMDKLEEKLHFAKDKRIRFAGTVYDQELLKKIRENAFGYLHGHEVGGTNPSLLEALGSTNLNLLLDVGFNREVAEDAALYWKKDEGSLACLINHADLMDKMDIRKLGDYARKRINAAYSWQHISQEYEQVFS
ncbi:MAG: glycosyltransferase family 1 protein [Lachnospiraceae bacterium]|nr:glycosyltransferase family 1 protein [Lachnospiraceae bacterium]